MKIRVIGLFFCGAFLLPVCSQESKKPAPPAEAEFTHAVSFKDLPLEFCLDFYGELTEQNIWLHPAQKSFNLNFKADFPKDELIKKLEALLATNGITFVEGGGELLVFHPNALKIDLPKTFLGQPTDAAKKSMHSFNFQETPLGLVLSLYDELTKEDLVLDPDSAWKDYTVTLVPRKKMSGEVAVQQLETVLHILGVVMNKSESGTQIHMTIPKTGLRAPPERARIEIHKDSAPDVQRDGKPARAVSDVQNRLQELQMETIRKGLPLLPIRLSDEQIEQLRKEGLVIDEDEKPVPDPKP